MTGDSLADSLAVVVAAWRRTRHPRLAELAEILGERLAVESPRPKLKASKKSADLEAWRAREAEGSALDFSVLMAAARGGAQTDVIAHVEALAAREDPRLAAGLLRLLEDPPYAGVKSRAMLRAIFVALDGCRDPRLSTRAPELAGRYLGIVNSSTGGWIIEQLEKLGERASKLPVPPLPPDVAAVCDALEARLGDAVRARRRETSEKAAGEQLVAGLFDAVYAAPDDDGPRLVLADALQQLGDARGELIVLQIERARGAQTPQQARREAELATTDRLAQWAQPLSNAGHCFFERGFPAEVSLYSNAKALKKTVGRPEWATVRTVTGLLQQPAKQAVELMTGPTLAGVRNPGPLDPPLLDALSAGGRRWPWTTLEIRVADGLAASALAATPELRELTLSATGPVQAGLLRPLAHLEKLEVTLVGVAPPPGLFDGATSLRQLVLGVNGANLKLDALALPPTLEKLTLGLGMPVPPDTLAGRTALRELSVRVPSFQGLAAELVLPSLESLSLTCRNAVPLPRRLFEGVPRLQRLHLALHGPRVTAELLGPLGDLKELHLSGEVAPGALASLARLESVRVWDVALDELPRAPLREARVTAPRSPEELARFLEHHPRLERLSLHVPDAVDVAALLPVLDGGAVRSVELDGSKTASVLLERDRAGVLTRMHVGRERVHLAKDVRKALRGLTQLTCDPLLMEETRRQLEQDLGCVCDRREGVSLD